MVKIEFKIRSPIIIPVNLADFTFKWEFGSENTDLYLTESNAALVVTPRTLGVLDPFTLGDIDDMTIR